MFFGSMKLALMELTPPEQKLLPREATEVARYGGTAVPVIVRTLIFKHIFVRILHL
jgi:hypothetical protein